MTSIWKPILGYEGRYEVSDRGQVRNAAGRVLTNKRRGRYVAVELYAEGEGKFFALHHLVLLAFVGQREAGQQACHNNGNPCDNRLENLRWDSASQNSADKAKHGTLASRATWHYRSKLSPQDVERIKADQRVSHLVAADYGVSSSLIRNIRCGISK